MFSRTRSACLAPRVVLACSRLRTPELRRLLSPCNQFIMSDKTVGMIGLGAMGLPMALNFISAGYSVVAYDLSAQAVARVVAKGAIEAGTPAEVAAKASIVVTMVPNDAILTSVVCNAETGIV